MAKQTDILKAIQARDWTTASSRLDRLMEQKVAKRLAQEKNDIATTLLVPRLAEGFRRGEKVVLKGSSGMGGYISTKPTGQRVRVTTGSVGEFVRQIDAQWSVVWFPGFYDSTEVRTKDLESTSLRLYDERIVEDAIEVGDRIRTKKMGQTPGTVVKVENGNVHFELDEPEGKFGKRIWVAPLSNVVREATEPKCYWCGDRFVPKQSDANQEDMFCSKACEDRHNDHDWPHSRTESVKTYTVPFKKKDGTTVDRKVTVPPSNNENRTDMIPSCQKCGYAIMNDRDTKCPRCQAKLPKTFTEEAVSQAEVQRIYNEVGDIGETELLCGISGLRVNPQGQVISYICEGWNPFKRTKTEPKWEKDLKSWATQDRWTHVTCHCGKSFKFDNMKDDEDLKCPSCGSNDWERMDIDEAWEKDPNCQQCRKPLSASDAKLGRVCGKCASGNKNKIYAKESFIIVKDSRGGSRLPYAGPACKEAGVPDGKKYSSRDAAEADAAKLEKVNPVGFKVIEESASEGTGFPNGWDRGWTYPYRIGGGGTERPFLKNGRWYLVVWNQETNKKEVYSFYDDVFIPEKQFYTEAASRWQGKANLDPVPCGKDCLKGDDVDADYYCGEGKPWKDHKFVETEADTSWHGKSNMPALSDIGDPRFSGINYRPENCADCGKKDATVLTDSGKTVCKKCAHKRGIPTFRTEARSNPLQTAFASDFGWRPGQWPKSFTQDGKTWELGRNSVQKDREGDIESVIYYTKSGDAMTVFND